MPTKHPFRKTRTKVQDALDVFDGGGADFIIILLLVVRWLVVSDNPVEKIGRRQLAIVADNNNLVTARNGANRIFRAHLAGLINYDNVKLEAAGL